MTGFREVACGSGTEHPAAYDGKLESGIW